MEHKVKVTREYEQVTKTTCDKCGAEVRESSDGYTYKITDIEFRVEERYPGSGSAKADSIDVCGKCSEELRKLIENFGFKFQSRELDW